MDRCLSEPDSKLGIRQRMWIIILCSPPVAVFASRRATTDTSCCVPFAETSLTVD